MSSFVFGRKVQTRQDKLIETRQEKTRRIKIDAAPYATDIEDKQWRSLVLFSRFEILGYKPQTMTKVNESLIVTKVKTSTNVRSC